MNGREDVWEQIGAESWRNPHAISACPAPRQRACLHSKALCLLDNPARAGKQFAALDGQTRPAACAFEQLYV